MKWLQRIYLACAYYFSISAFLIVSLMVNFFCLILVVLPGSTVWKKPLRATLQFLFRRWAWCMRFLRVVDLQTPSKTAKKSKDGEIWIMNHPSILDASYLLKFITNGVCIYKREIAGNPFYGATAKLADFIPSIGGPDMIRLACDALACGENLIVFPEGTRSTVVNVDNFKPGFALIAKRSKSAINVLWMDSPPDFMTREVPFWRVPRLTAHVTIELTSRIEPLRHKSVDEIMAEVKQCYRRMAGE